jgi:hypothetical protein
MSCVTLSKTPKTISISGTGSTGGTRRTCSTTIRASTTIGRGHHARDTAAPIANPVPTVTEPTNGVLRVSGSSAAITVVLKAPNSVIANSFFISDSFSIYRIDTKYQEAKE